MSKLTITDVIESLDQNIKELRYRSKSDGENTRLEVDEIELELLAVIEANAMHGAKILIVDDKHNSASSVPVHKIKIKLRPSLTNNGSQGPKVYGENVDEWEIAK